MSIFHFVINKVSTAAQRPTRPGTAFLFMTTCRKRLQEAPVQLIKVCVCVCVAASRLYHSVRCVPGAHI